ncbi:ricin-type beta-trefoil lectin domain protein [Streptomyces sp. NPDC088354]|uniref:ricin-type beta-trefoil lectin domain protein n=1 Tax=Streptomyces sp. NPDC088354 TaxID=3365856 RepID=UPI0037F5869D
MDTNEPQEKADSVYADGFAAGFAFASYPETAASAGTPTPEMDQHANTAGKQTPGSIVHARRFRWALLFSAGLAISLLLSLPIFAEDSDSDGSGSTATPLTVTTPSITHSTKNASKIQRPSPGRTPSQSAPRTSPSSTRDSDTDVSVPPQDSEASKDTSGGQADTGLHDAASPSSEAGSGVSIRNHVSNRCIDGGSMGIAPLQIRGCSPSASQLWEILAEDRIIRAASKCMDVVGGSTEDGAVIQLLNCNGSDSQSFRLNTSHDLVNLQAHKCVEATDASGSNGTTLRLWTCTGARNQKWSASD